MQSEEEIRRKLAEKFNNYESAPREESWDKIRTSIQLSQMFQNYEAEPQDDSWEKIRAGADLAQKMKEFEADPQEDSWKKISAGVDLSQKFKDYEAEPQAISWLKIQEAIQPKKRRRGIFIPLQYRVGIAAGLILLVGSLWWTLNKQENHQPAVADSAVKKPSVSSRMSDTSQNKNNRKEANSTSEKKSIQQPDSFGSAKNDAFASHISKEKRDKIVLPSSNNTAKNQIKTAVNTKRELLATVEKGIKAESVKKSESFEVLANASVARQTEEQLMLVEELTGKTFQQQPIRKPFNTIAYNTEKPYQEKEQRIPRDIVFNASLMPLQTYQAFTILPQTNTYIQQVGRLDAIDNQRLGIQLRAGAMKPLSNRFAMGLSATYTGLQQWANYELNNGEYEVQTTANGSYTLVGIGELVSQKQFLQTVGLKLDNAYLVSRKKNAVYAIAGGEAVHVLNKKDFGYYVNASVGISYPIKGGKSLWIEPTFRYGLSQSFDANNYLKIRPYNIGLNIRVNFI